MAHLEWTADLDTGIQVIDKQHRRIVDYINKLHHAQKTADKDEVGTVLDELVDYTLSHFAFEESLMEESGYAYINAHKKVHQLFVKRVADYQQRFKIGEDVADELLRTLRAWLINHIKNDDQDYSDDVRATMPSGKQSKSGGWIKRLFGACRVSKPMSRIEWKADLEIGIPVIDGQHRRIVDYINELSDVGEDRDRAVIDDVIENLIDYTYSHFAFEESLMEEAGYDALAIHQTTHRAFRERVDALQARHRAGDEIARDLAHLLRTWLLQHIASDDRSYADLVREKMPRIECQQGGTWIGSALRRFFR